MAAAYCWDDGIRLRIEWCESSYASWECNKAQRPERAPRQGRGGNEPHQRRVRAPDGSRDWVTERYALLSTQRRTRCGAWCEERAGQPLAPEQRDKPGASSYQQDNPKNKGGDVKRIGVQWAQASGTQMSEHDRASPAHLPPLQFHNAHTGPALSCRADSRDHGIPLVRTASYWWRVPKRSVRKPGLIPCKKLLNVTAFRRNTPFVSIWLLPGHTKCRSLMQIWAQNVDLISS